MAKCKFFLFLMFLSPVIDGEQLNIGNSREERSPFGFLSQFISPAHPEPTKNDQCAKHGGVLVLDECFEYISSLMNFADAQAECSKRGGHIWIPRLDSPLLFNILFRLIPEAASANKETLWIGVKTDFGSIPYDIYGNDVSEEFLIKLRPHMNNKCIAFKFERGAFYPEDKDCTELIDFLCEYPLETKEDIEEINFNKFIYKFG